MRADRTLLQIELELLTVELVFFAAQAFALLLLARFAG
jgi:hypothetical protein